MYLDRAFFAADPVTVARDLVGAVLEVTAPGTGRASGRIVEVEAYGGPDDPASHAAGGPTPRSAIMFGPPGVAYVYFIYGMHHCLNVVTGPTGSAGAVLIRALEPLRGRDVMARRRGLDPRAAAIATSSAARAPVPGARHRPRLERPAGRRGACDRAGAAGSPATGRGGEPPAARGMPRIGVRRAAEVPWRFCDPDSACLSRRRTDRRVPSHGASRPFRDD